MILFFFFQSVEGIQSTFCMQFIFWTADGSVVVFEFFCSVLCWRGAVRKFLREYIDFLRGKKPDCETYRVVNKFAKSNKAFLFFLSTKNNFALL